MFTKWSLSHGLDSQDQLWEVAREVKETNEDLKKQALQLQRLACYNVQLVCFLFGISKATD